jgi:hypothetical protein
LTHSQEVDQFETGNNMGRYCNKRKQTHEWIYFKRVTRVKTIGVKIRAVASLEKAVSNAPAEND